MDTPEVFLDTISKDINIYPDGRVDTKNAAKYLGLSKKTLDMMRCNGKGPKYIKRGRVFYYIKDLYDWLNEDGRVKSTSQAKSLRLLNKAQDL